MDKNRDKLTIKDLETIANIRGGKCLSAEYWGLNKELSWMCEMGHTFDMAPSLVVQGGWCLQCESRGSKEKTFARLLQKIKEMGGKYISGEYENSSSPLMIECGSGHIFSIQAQYISLDRWCAKCAKEAYRKKREKDIFPSVLKWAEKHEGVCLSAPSEYLNKHSELNFKCKSGHKFKRSLISTRKNYWCDKCEKNSHADEAIFAMNKVAKKRGGKCLSVPSDYKDKLGFLLFECKNGHKFKKRRMEITAGQWCVRCNKEASNEKMLMELKVKARALGLTLLSNNYKPLVLFKFKCKYGHVVNRTRYEILLKRGCQQCSKNKRYNEIQDIAKARGGKLLTKSYDSPDKISKWKCKEGHIWQTKFFNVVYGGLWCPTCRGNSLKLGQLKKDKNRLKTATKKLKKR